MARGLHPDTATEISLTGTAQRLHTDGLPEAQIIAELRKIAGGRADLLAKAAANHLGGWLSEPGKCHPATVTWAGLLVQAGADPTTVLREIETVKGNVGRSGYVL